MAAFVLIRLIDQSGRLLAVREPIHREEVDAAELAPVTQPDAALVVTQVIEDGHQGFRAEAVPELKIGEFLIAAFARISGRGHKRMERQASEMGSALQHHMELKGAPANAQDGEGVAFFIARFGAACQILAANPAMERWDIRVHIAFARSAFHGSSPLIAPATPAITSSMTSC